MKIYHYSISILLLLSFLSCSKTDSVDLTVLDDLSGDYIAFGDDYRVSTVLEKKSDNIYIMTQDETGEEIKAVMLKDGNMVFGALQDEERVAIAVYELEGDCFYGVWFAGEDIYNEYISIYEKAEPPIFNLARASENLGDIYDIEGISGTDKYNMILFIEKTGDNTCNLLWSSEDAMQIGLGIINGDVLSAAFFSDDFSFWGVAVYKINEDSSIEGKWVAYGQYIINSETGHVK